MSIENVIIRVLGIATVFGIVSWFFGIHFLLVSLIWAVVGTVFAVRKTAGQLNVVEMTVGVVIGYVVMAALTWGVVEILTASIGTV